MTIHTTILLIVEWKIGIRKILFTRDDFVKIEYYINGRHNENNYVPLFVLQKSQNLLALSMTNDFLLCASRVSNHHKSPSTASWHSGRKLIFLNTVFCTSKIRSGCSARHTYSCVFRPHRPWCKPRLLCLPHFIYAHTDRVISVLELLVNDNDRYYNVIPLALSTILLF